MYDMLFQWPASMATDTVVRLSLIVALRDITYTKLREEDNYWNDVIGESGVRVGFKGSQEPELVDFGDLYANFLFSGNGGSMEVNLLTETMPFCLALLMHKIVNLLIGWLIVCLLGWRTGWMVRGVV